MWSSFLHIRTLIKRGGLSVSRPSHTNRMPTDSAAIFLSAVDAAVLNKRSSDKAALVSMIAALVDDCEGVDEIRDISEPFLVDLGLDHHELDTLFASLSVEGHRYTTALAPAEPAEEIVKPLQKSKRYTNKLAKPASPPPPLQEIIVDSPEIIATSIQSRFHADTLETLSNDVDLKKVNISVGESFHLLVDAHLKLFAGVHYGLIGRNGVGKSTLLRVMSDGTLIGFPNNLKVLYVEQLEDVSTDRIVLDVVMDADRKVQSWKQRISELQAAQESHTDTAMAKAVRSLNLANLTLETEAMRKLAIKRSGARGKECRNALVELEARVTAMTEAHKLEISTEEILSAPLVIHSSLEALYSQLQAFDVAASESRARKVLNGLGFSKASQDGPLQLLSGGWKIRVALAQALFMEPDILLLDEPTNHLDLPAILWLQRYLQSLDGVTLLVVSHDRAFLNAIVTEIIELRNQQLTYHAGNYDEFVSNLEDKRKRDRKRQEALDKKREHIEKSIQDGLRHAKKTGDDKKMGMVKSRQRKLEERHGLEVNEKGHRFKLNRDLGGYHLTNRRGIEMDVPDATPNWSIPEPEPLRNKSALVQLERVFFAYSAPPRKFVLNNVTLNIEMGQHIGIVGGNGQGKSTLVKLIVGTLDPSNGTIARHPKVRIAHVSQDLTTSLPLTQTPLQLMRERFPNDPEPTLRAHLGGFGVGGIATRPLSTFSGGQRVRVAVALEVYGGKNLLVLDEPTNHLDMSTIEAMLEALKEHQAAVIVVSHDQYFVERCAHTVYLVDDGTCSLLEGGVKEYVSRIVGK
ncbi:P-loop containing nucleoside triphosphate hydrolase protein [Chytriomyces sp. MP71]|nr:P-loop containing nucleoside triphosphate hydrolase protein [Chytriomyces sp. MP71]